MAAEDIGALVVRIEANLKNFEGNMNKATKRVDGFGSTVKKIGGLIAGAFAVKAIVGFGKTMVTAASDAKEMQSKFNTVFGEMSKSTEDWAKDFRDAVGGSKVEIKSMLADSADLLAGFGATEEQSLDLSTKIQSLGTDIASFSNIQGGAEEAVTKLRKGLMGETENLKSLGIVINQKMLQDTLTEKGDTRKLKDLSELEKMELRYSIAVRQSTNAIGDAEKTSGGFANQMRNLKGQIKDFTASLGEKLLPMAQKLLDWVLKHMPEIEAFGRNAFESIGNAVKDVSNALEEHVLPVLIALWEWIEPNLPKIKQFFIDTFNAAVGVVEGLIDAIKSITKWMQDHWAIVEPILIGIGAGAAAFGLITAAIWLWNTAVTIATATTAAFGAVLAFITSPIGLIVIAIGLLIAAGVALYKNWDVIKVKLKSFWKGIKDVFGNIKKFVLGVWDDISNGIRGTINFIIRGMNKMIDGLNSLKFKIPDWIPGIGGEEFGLNIAKIKEIAKKMATPMGLGGAQQFAKGTNFVPFDMPAFIHKGEAVVPADNNPNNPNANDPIGGNINYDGMFNGAIFNVRSDNDVKLIAREIYNLQSQRRRGSGVVPA